MMSIATRDSKNDLLLAVYVMNNGLMISQHGRLEAAWRNTTAHVVTGSLWKTEKYQILKISFEKLKQQIDKILGNIN